MKAIACLFRPMPAVFAAASIVFTFGFTGCAPAGGETIVIRGSNTIGEELAPSLAAEFRKTHPELKFDFEFKGTSYGFGALMVGKCNVAAASREMGKTELALAKERAFDVNEYTIGHYSVAVVVNAGNPVANLTKEQVRDIFTGVVQNWKDVGGPDVPVILCVRDPISGAHLGFKELAMENRSYAENIHAYTNHAGITRAVANEPGAIGYVSIEAAGSTGTKAVSIGGIAPSLAAVQKGEYPYGRQLRLFTDKARESAAAKSFIEFAQSAPGRKIITDLGYVPKS